MGKRHMTSVEELPLVGGRLCLDFVNTTGARASPAPRERLHTYRDLLVWAHRAGLLTEADRVALAQAVRGTDRGVETVERALGIRETLYAVLRPLAEGSSPNDVELSALDELLVEAARHRRLRVRSGGIDIEWSHESDPLGWFLWPVVHSADKLLMQDDPPALKRCGECDWLFVDETRNDSRRWCKKQCGDRVRARRYYRKHKES